MGEGLNIILTGVILIGLFIIIYARVKKQTLSETWEEITELFKEKEEQVRGRLGEIRRK